MAMNYTQYLKVDELLALQEPKSDPAEHDEMLFIVIHQVYELWFKLVLHEFARVANSLRSADLYGAIAGFQRVRSVMKTLVGQLDILETMTPMSFSTFRDRLDTASGFQSAQFREVEFFLGHKRPAAMDVFPEGSAQRVVLERRLREPSLVDAFHAYLEGEGVTLPDEIRKKDVTAPTMASTAIQDAVLTLYKDRPEVAILLELMTDFDEGLQEWRYRHVKMVERTIGNKKGTGGSMGVEFLKKTLFQPIFPDLWAVRHRF
jgi:tryptophan 2,3-dioxygenase